jgi:hypothetical protein
MLLEAHPLVVAISTMLFAKFWNHSSATCSNVTNDCESIFYLPSGQKNLKFDHFNHEL